MNMQVSQVKEQLKACQSALKALNSIMLLAGPLTAGVVGFTKKTSEPVPAMLEPNPGFRRRSQERGYGTRHSSVSASGLGLASAGVISFTVILTVWFSTLPLADLTS